MVLRKILGNITFRRMKCSLEGLCEIKGSKFKLCSYTHFDTLSLGIWRSDISQIVDLKSLCQKFYPKLPTEFITLRSLLMNQKCFLELIKQAYKDEEFVIDQHKIVPRSIVPHDVKIIGAAKNYRNPNDPNSSSPKTPIIFVKPSNTIIGPFDSTVLPQGDTKTVLEAELAVIIGYTAKNISPSMVKDYILGFTAINDLTDKSSLSLNESFPLTLGKYYDTYLPCSSTLLVDSSYDYDDKNIQAYLNDKLVQNHSTKNMFYGVNELVSYISKYITLEPGDCILTGTPYYLEPEATLYLKDGDTVYVEVEGLDPLTTLIRSQ